jgi:hypothetical protein
VVLKNKFHLSGTRTRRMEANSVNLSLCCSLNVRNQLSHPYKTTGKVIRQCSLIFAL